MKARFRVVKSTFDDLEVERQGASPLRILGPAGPDRELAVLEALKPNEPCLPVLLGTGMGHALNALLARHSGPVALLDKEHDLLAAAHMPPKHERLVHISHANSEEALAALTRWQAQNGDLPLKALVHPFYQRLDPAWYGGLRKKLEQSARINFWSKARQPRFQNAETRLLLITSRYFLLGEIEGACRRLGVACRMLTLPDDEMSSAAFVEALLKDVLEFRPDAVLTLNHLGMDREGVLTDLLARLELPLASWFVDNPHLVLHLYEGLSSPWVTLFSWDKDNLPSLKAQGFSHVFHLPLGTDPERFCPGRTGPDAWRAQVSFVGNSMRYKVGQRLQRTHFPAVLLRNVSKIAAAFAASQERSVREFLLAYFPEQAAAWLALPGNEAMLGYETLLTWESTRQYRQQCVEKLFDFEPLIVGDRGWNIAFRNETRPWRWHNALSYYDDLPRFYPMSAINFNSTSMQMKGAVNQRVFDVPAAGAFVLTDWHEEMDELFPKGEVPCYKHPDEVPDLLRYYLKHEAERRKLTLAARNTVLARHTWDSRLQSLIETMRGIYRS